MSELTIETANTTYNGKEAQLRLYYLDDLPVGADILQDGEVKASNFNNTISEIKY